MLFFLAHKSKYLILVSDETTCSVQHGRDARVYGLTYYSHGR